MSIKRRLPKSQSFRSSATIRNAKPAFKIKDIGVNSKKETGTVGTTSYTKSWIGVSETELKRILETIKRMEKGAWVAESSIEMETMANPTKSNVKWTYKVIR